MHLPQPFTINVNDRLLDLSRPCVMGILNATPDSFYAASRQQTEAAVAHRAEEIIRQGGTIIDVGAFSTRPGADEVTQEEEMRRLHVALTAVRGVAPEAVLSVDTFRPEVARMVVEEFGAAIINDVSEGGVTGIVGQALQDTGDEVPAMFRTVADLKVAYVLMAVSDSLLTMMPQLARKLQQLHELGVADVLVDPGFGFGKTLADNYRLLDQLEVMHALRKPLLVGVSRKSMLFRLLGTTPDETLSATVAAHTIALMKGAAVLRVHDVADAVAAIRVVEACRGVGLPPQ